MRANKNIVLLAWFFLLIAYLSVIVVNILWPSIQSSATKLLSTLDSLTRGVATPLLFAFVIPGLVLTVWYVIDVLRISRSKTSAIHLAMSTMHFGMFKSRAEMRARDKFRDLAGSPEPHIFFFWPTDKDIDAKLRQEVLP